MILRFSRCLCVGLVCLLVRSEGWAAEDSHGADDVVVVVARVNPVQTLTTTQVEDIFLGRTLVFPDGRRAIPIDLPEGVETRERFYTGLLGRTAAQIRAHWSRLVFTGRGRPPRDVDSGEELLQVMANDPQTIGYIERHLVNDTVRVVLE